MVDGYPRRPPHRSTGAPAQRRCAAADPSSENMSITGCWDRTSSWASVTPTPLVVRQISNFRPRRSGAPRRSGPRPRARASSGLARRRTGARRGRVDCINRSMARRASSRESLAHPPSCRPQYHSEPQTGQHQHQALGTGSFAEVYAAASEDLVEPLGRLLGGGIMRAQLHRWTGLGDRLCGVGPRIIRRA